MPLAGASHRLPPIELAVGDGLFPGDEPLQLILFRLELGALDGDLSLEGVALVLGFALAALDLLLAIQGRGLVANLLGLAP